MSSRLKSLARSVLPRSVRNVLRAPGRSIWWGLAELRHAVGLDGTERVRDGFAVRCHPAAWSSAYHAQIDDPEQVAEFDSFVAACTPGMYLFDLGAHFGLFSLAALHYGGPTARALAVDASPVATRMVRIQARINGVASRLTVIEVMVGDHVGTDAMVSTGVLGAGYYVPADADHRGETAAVPMSTLDALAARHGDPTHVKIDVEGYEADVLRGGRAVIERARPLLFVELHNDMLRERGADPGTTLDLLSELGYEIQTTGGAAADRGALLAAGLVRVVAVPSAAASRRAEVSAADRNR